MTKPKKQKLDALNVMNEILAQLDKLSDRRRTWEDGLQRAATDELYLILEGCLALYARMIDSNALKKILTTILKKRNVTQTAGSSLQLKVVRYVFGECGQEHTYARTIAEAYTSKPKDISFIDWLKSVGGPSGLKRSTAKKESDFQAHIESAISHYEASTPISLQSDPRLSANKDAPHTFAIALVRVDLKDPTKRDIVFGCNNVGLVNRVLEQAGKTLPQGIGGTAHLAAVPSDLNLNLAPLTNGGQS